MAEPTAKPSLLQRLDAADRAISTRLVAPMQEDGRVRAWVRVLRRFSESGSYGTGWIVLFAIVAATGRGGFIAAFAAAACVLGMLLVNTGVKVIIRRPRPVLRAIDHQPGSFSMPSAHTSMAVVGAATMSYLVPVAAPLWWTITVVLACSRVILGMHFFADVLVGFLLGALMAWLVAVPLVAALA